MCPFDYTAVAGEWEVGPVNQVNHTSWVAVVTPTDRPKSVRNCCLIEAFVSLFVLSLCPFDISVGVGAFVAYMCNNFYGLSTSVGCWSSAFTRRIIYKFLNVCPFDYTAFVVSGKVGIA